MEDEIKVWKIKPHHKGGTFLDRKLTYEFDISNCIIEMDFYEIGKNPKVFSWSTLDDTIEKINSTQIVMKNRIY